MLERLLALQELDEELDRLKAEAEDGPRRTETARECEGKARALLDETAARFEQVSKQRVELESNLKLEEQRLFKSKSKLKQLKTHFEFAAMQREIDSTKRANSEIEEGILKSMEEIEQLTKRMEELDARWKKAAEDRERVETQVKAQSAGLEELLAEKSAEHERMLAGIDPKVLSQYNLIRRRRNRNAVVAIVDGSCRGCFMNIPHQTVNELMRERKLGTCPNCSRLIYVSAPQ